MGATERNGRFTLIPVRPDWSDGSDLIGYRDIKGDFKDGPLTKVIKRAKLELDKPFFVLLDEMNLARVEYYFSDFLSVMESRDWGNGGITSSLILTKEEANENIWFPENLYIIGTVNMDETTHPFSKKVLDRANTLEFNRVQLDYLDFLTDTIPNVQQKNIDNKMFRSEFLYLKDMVKSNMSLIEEISTQLFQINKYIQPIGAQVGYRVRDEICMYVAYNQSGQLLTKEQAFDNCILQKILPRISGSDSRVKRSLSDLFRFLTNKVVEFDIENYEQDLKLSKYPRSATKVYGMLRRLEDDGFTSFLDQLKKKSSWSKLKRLIFHLSSKGSPIMRDI
ncbi:McrB family protein [Bacillus sp. DJP31]|uniref:McrB family protein n=1 Tax=Bacillus sp. DJP31 TaxID=3409789 RepID=UPI003BB5835A